MSEKKTKFRTVNATLGKQPNIGPFPADQLVPWGIIGGVSYYLCHGLLKLNWKSASMIVPASLIKKAVSQNSNAGDIDLNKIKALKFNRGKGGLYLFDFNSPQLCGAGGCLYAVYRETGEKLLSLLANPNLPKGETLFWLDNTVENSLPCLIITQATTAPGTVLRNQYCYKGQGFMRVNEALTPVRK